MMNSVTLSEPTAISETIPGFKAMVNRLGIFGVLSNDVSTPLKKIETLNKWADLYIWIVNPLTWDEKLLKK